MRYSLLGKFIILFIAVFLLLFVYVRVNDINNYPTLIEYTKLKDLYEEQQTKSMIEENFGSEIVRYIKKNDKIRKDTNVKYILQWTSPKNVPFVYMGKGQEVFIKRPCKYTNCFVTSDPSYLGDITKFDVVAFNGPDIIHMKKERLPQARSPHQKYVFASIESSHYYPVCNSILDGYFNWTWTFKLDSDSKWGYLVVRNMEGDIIGPKKEMHWMKVDDMKPVPNELLPIIKGKSKAAAWFVSNCRTKSKREIFVKDLQIELDKYGLKIDIYGKCGNFKCNRWDEKKCEKLIEDNYFFYLAFENSFCEDYVTEKILHGLQYTAIPIVYGGANYTRFVPDGSYINARELGVKELAAKMNKLIHNIGEYASYFKWKNHYSFHRRVATVETDDYCGFCALLNNEKKTKETTVYPNFRKWWNSGNFSCVL